jgi:hypothetical protein
MSRNFELLTEMEREWSAQEPLPSTLTAATPYRPDDSLRGILSGGDQQMRLLVQRVFLSMNGSAARQVVFFGVDGASNSSRVCAAAGRMLSYATSKRVCLVEGNVRSSRLYSTLGIEGVPRLMRRDGAGGEMCLEVGANLWLAKLAGLSGKQGEFPSIEEMRRFFRALEEQFDYVLIDAPDANATDDALVLSSIADGSILVVEAHHTRKLNARIAKEKCDAAGVTLLGTVLDNRTFPIPERLYRLF